MKTERKLKELEKQKNDGEERQSGKVGEKSKENKLHRSKRRKK